MIESHVIEIGLVFLLISSVIKKKNLFIAILLFIVFAIITLLHSIQYAVYTVLSYIQLYSSIYNKK